MKSIGWIHTEGYYSIDCALCMGSFRIRLTQESLSGETCRNGRVR